MHLDRIIQGVTPRAGSPGRRMKETPPPPGFDHPGKGGQRRKRGSMKTPVAAGRTRFTQGVTRRTGASGAEQERDAATHPHEWIIRGKGAKGELGAARRQRKTTRKVRCKGLEHPGAARRRSRKKMLLDCIIQ